VLLRSIRAHLWTSLATLGLAFVVAAGSVGVVGASRVASTPGAVAAMLALYGAVALAEQSARSVVDRSHDVALARLRGLHGGRLVLFAAAPLLTISLIGVLAGSAVGTWLARRIVDGWGLSYDVGTREFVVAVGVLLGAWVTIAVVAAAVIRRPLVDALSVHPRRHPTSWVTTFLELLLVTAACLAVYEAHRNEQGWVATVAPALVALGAGQLVMWALALTPRLGTRLGLSLATRRLRRDPDPGSVVRIMVAAAVLLAVTLTGGRTAADWRDDAGRLRAGGPIVMSFDDGALRAYAAAHDADPQGKWLMAAVAIDDLDPVHRRVFVDAGRWNAVVGDFLRDTSVGGAVAHIDSLAGQDGPVLMRADSLQVDVDSIGDDDTGVVTVRYLSDQGFAQVAKVRVDHVGTATGRLGSCAIGCALLSVDLSGAPFDVAGVTAGGVRLLGSTSYAGARARRAVKVGPTSEQAAGLVTHGLQTAGIADGIDGTRQAMRVVGSVGAIPFLGRAGSLLDLGQVLRGSVGTVAGARSVVVARADTPPTVMAALRRAGGSRPTTYADVADRLEATAAARADSLTLLVAIGVGLVALTHLVAWLAGQLGRRRAEVAGLRAAGIGPRAVRRAYVLEAAVLSAVVLVAAAVTAAVTTVPLLEPIQLVSGWSEAPRLHLAVRPLTLATVVVGVAVLTALLCAVVFTRFGRAARPAALRSAEQ
jgi:hypothetical protein